MNLIGSTCALKGRPSSPAAAELNAPVVEDVQASIDEGSVDRLTELAAAARVLSELMEERLMSSPGGFREVSLRL
jgi:hypothetical protein